MVFLLCTIEWDITMVSLPSIHPGHPTFPHPCFVTWQTVVECATSWPPVIEFTSLLNFYVLHQRRHVIRALPIRSFSSHSMASSTDVSSPESEENGRGIYTYIVAYLISRPGSNYRQFNLDLSENVVYDVIYGSWQMYLSFWYRKIFTCDYLLLKYGINIFGANIYLVKI